MTMRRTLAVSLVALLPLAGCATVPPLPDARAHAELMTSGGKRAGRATLSASGANVILTIQAVRLKPGLHGAHLHAQGACKRPTFASAGPHLNPAMHQHGSLNPAGQHLGDLPNIEIAADGAGAATITLPGEWATLEGTIFDADGTALVIHASPDDYLTDPSGKSGDRIVCGVFVRE